MEELSFEASFPETLVVWMSQLQSLLTENSKGNLILLNELRDVLEKKSLSGRDFFQRPPAPTHEIFSWVGALFINYNKLYKFCFIHPDALIFKIF